MIRPVCKQPTKEDYDDFMPNRHSCQAKAGHAMIDGEFQADATIIPAVAAKKAKASGSNQQKKKERLTGETAPPLTLADMGIAKDTSSKAGLHAGSAGTFPTIKRATVAGS